ncbi:unnamed protein product, partial [Strongylus vulgaris]
MTLKRIQEIVSSQSEPNRSSQSDEIHLYLHERKFDSALKIYLSLKDPQIFAVIDKYLLFEQLAYLTKLLNKNEGAEYADQAVRLYADH